MIQPISQDDREADTHTPCSAPEQNCFWVLAATITLRHGFRAEPELDSVGYSRGMRAGRASAGIGHAAGGDQNPSAGGDRASGAAGLALFWREQSAGGEGK